MNNGNREQWLTSAAERLRPLFKTHGATFGRCRIAVGFTSKGTKTQRIGECWDSSASDDNTFEIFLRCDLADPVQILAILAHELVHAAVGLDKQHGPAFRKLALAIGLEGKMTATTPGEAFTRFAITALGQMEPYPHAPLNFARGASTGPKKQVARMHKVKCEGCGYTARVATSWLEDVGAPIRPCNQEPMTIDGVKAPLEELIA